MTAYQQELALAAREGVNHPDNLPFLLQPAQSNGRGVLLVHGFTATPREMRALGEVLYAQNFTVYGVRLPGHGTTPEDLAGRKLEDWLAAVDRGYQILMQLKLPICAVGLSTGALLLLQLCQQRSFTGLVLLSPFLQLRHALAPFAGLLRFFYPYQHRSITAAEQPFYYQRRPLQGIAQINRLRRQVKSVLPKIDLPVLVLAATGDATIAPGSARQLYNRLGSRKKQFHCYGPDVPHVLTTGENPQQQDVFIRVAAVLTQLH